MIAGWLLTQEHIPSIGIPLGSLLKEGQIVFSSYSSVGKCDFYHFILWGEVGLRIPLF